MNKLNELIIKFRSYPEVSEYDSTSDNQSSHSIRVLGTPDWYLLQCYNYGFNVITNHLPLEAIATNSSGAQLAYVEGDCILSYNPLLKALRKS